MRRFWQHKALFVWRNGGHFSLSTRTPISWRWNVAVIVMEQEWSQASRIALQVFLSICKCWVNVFWWQSMLHYHESRWGNITSIACLSPLEMDLLCDVLHLTGQYMGFTCAKCLLGGHIKQQIRCEGHTNPPSELSEQTLYPQTCLMFFVHQLCCIEFHSCRMQLVQVEWSVWIR